MYYILIDEVQYAISKEELKNPENIRLYNVLNGLMRLRNVDIYVTGSNSKMLTKDVLTAFRGRGDEVKVYPISFREYYNHVGGDKSEVYEEYALFGGMPLVYVQKSDAAKMNYLRGLFTETYFKDIVERYDIELPEVFENLTDDLCSSVGSITNATKLADTLTSVKKMPVSSNTVSNYINHLTESFLFSEAKRYDVKGKKYFEYPLKYNCTDIGLRNARLNFRQQEETHIMENIIYNELLVNRLQKCIDIVFPEFNSLFKSKYGVVYMSVLRTFSSAEAVANADIRSIRKCFEYKGRGCRISLTAEKLKMTAKASIGIPSAAEEIQIRHLVSQIELPEEQLSEIDKRIEEFSIQNNSTILSIPGISHFSGTSILAELGDICNYKKASQIIKFAGVAPYHYESSQFTAQHTAITKKGSRYLRKTLYQIIVPVIFRNEIFHTYYNKKLAEGKGHRCAQGHCIRKLLRVIYHLLTTGQQFSPELLV